MTSNIGSLCLLDGLTDDGEIREDARERVMGELRSHDPSSSTGSTRSCCSSRSCSGEIERIVDLQIDDVKARLAGRRLDVRLTEPARALIARQGYDPVYGARPLRRYIQREVETRIGRALIAGDIREDTTITIDADGGELLVRWREGEAADRRAERETVAA